MCPAVAIYMQGWSRSLEKAVLLSHSKGSRAYTTQAKGPRRGRSDGVTWLPRGRELTCKCLYVPALSPPFYS